MSVELIGHCLGMGGVYASPQYIRMQQNYTQCILTSADFILRTAPLHARTCALCTEINEQAA